MNIRRFYYNTDRFAERCWTEIVSYAHANSTFLLFALGVILCSYSYELFNQTLSIDDEILIWSAGPDQEWIRQGRWGMYLIYCIFTNPGIPFSGLFLTLILNTLAFLVIFSALKQNSSCRFLLFPLFITAPIMYFVYTFNSLMPGVGIGIFCAALAVRLAQAANSRWYLIFPAMCLGAFAVGCYQAILNVLMLLVCFFLIDDLIFKQMSLGEFAKKILLAFLLGVGVLVLYYGGDQLAMAFVENSTRLYLSQFSVSNNIPSLFERFFYFIWAVYKGAPGVYGVNLFSQCVLFVGCIGIIVWRIWFLQISWWRKGIVFVLTGLVIFIPFCLCLILNFWETRGLFSLIWVIPFLFLLAWNFSSYVLRFLLAGIAIACIFQNLFVNNKLAYSNELNFERDKTLAVRVLSRIDHLPVKSNIPHDIPLMILGEPSVQSFPQATPFVNVGMIGRSFFNHKGGAVHRIEKLFSFLGNNWFRPASVAEKNRVIKQAVSLPYFPASDSITVIDGVVVVAFSPPTLDQLVGTNFTTNIISQRPNTVKEYYGTVENCNLIYQLTTENADFSHAHLSLEKGNTDTIRLRITGDDPRFVLSKIPVDAAKEYLMEFVFDSDHDDELHMFFKESEKDPYSGTHLIKLKMNQGENRFVLRVPGRILCFPVRLDPGYGKAKHVIIKRIAVLEQKHER